MNEKKDSPIGDIIKKVVSVGVGAAFMTEESVKKILEDLPLPKDIISGLVQNAKGAKEDFTNGIREEMRLKSLGNCSKNTMLKLKQNSNSKKSLNEKKPNSGEFIGNKKRA